ncbi:ribosome biogenesis protein Nop16 [Pisolithus orientalis]|uniref:ribosome biogenesis protein Nop16 n=1 Tax=Pisolithus orientalis TaxID=936130 RepID=UPI0022255671|nr:ribosome biogenesis protein Nop16 [Pisolithus orientalis]KAI6019679.1 ribosome biogenesis protein Nop16 [Pisolithus orientalis]
MANPRQRRKRKSGHAPISHSRRAKKMLKKMPTIRGPKALQDAWDKAKTVRQNYLAFGLQHTLNPIPSGGTEVDLRQGCPDRVKTEIHSCHEGEKDPDGLSVVKKVVPSGFGRIVRDETGVVIGVELAEDEERGPVPDMETLEPCAADADRQVWAQGGTADDNMTSPAESSVIRRLERLSEHTEVRVRHTSQGERMYMARLAKKYGDDYEKMARDRRLNPEQRTVGQLKRAVGKAGGIAELCRE